MHGTHVAGIAAGKQGCASRATDRRRVLPPRTSATTRATVSTIVGVGLNGNSPEIAKGIETAVRDGMDVINLSLGEPEIEPSRDLVVRRSSSLGRRCDPGAPPATIRRVRGRHHRVPRQRALAITVAAVTEGGSSGEFSSAGPTPVSLQLKPEVTAPAGDIVSSVPAREGTWARFSGTSMAAPHVAGAPRCSTSGTPPGRPPRSSRRSSRPELRW